MSDTRKPFPFADQFRELAAIWDDEAARAKKWATDHPHYDEAARHARGRANGLIDAAMSLRRVIGDVERGVVR